MTLGELAVLVDVDPKWLLNAAGVVALPKPYSLALARRLAVTRALCNDLGLPLPRAFAMAAEALRRYQGGTEPVALAPGRARDVEIRVDVRRMLSALNVRRSQLRTMHAPRRRGPRLSTRGDPIRAAADFGIDLSLLRANLRRTPAERLQQLEAMSSFRRRVRRTRSV